MDNYSTDLSTWTLDASATQTPAAAMAGIETVAVTLAAPSNGKLLCAWKSRHNTNEKR
jgi:hypothetical protein